MKLAGMTASVAGNYAKTKLKTLFLDEAASNQALDRLHDLNGGKIAETLGERLSPGRRIGGRGRRYLWPLNSGNYVEFLIPVVVTVSEILPTRTVIPGIINSGSGNCFSGEGKPFP